MMFQWSEPLQNDQNNVWKTRSTEIKHEKVLSGDCIVIYYTTFSQHFLSLTRHSHSNNDTIYMETSLSRGSGNLHPNWVWWKMFSCTCPECSRCLLLTLLHQHCWHYLGAAHVFTYSEVQTTWHSINRRSKSRPLANCTTKPQVSGSCGRYPMRYVQNINMFDLSPFRHNSFETIGQCNTKQI